MWLLYLLAWVVLFRLLVLCLRFGTVYYFDFVYFVLRLLDFTSLFVFNWFVDVVMFVTNWWVLVVLVHVVVFVGCCICVVLLFVLFM